MKTIAMILFLSPIWAINSLGQENEVTGLLNNSESRTAIFSAILNDHQLMMDFMDAMKDNNHAMMMMRSDSAMMGNPSMGGMHNSGEHKMMGMNNDSAEMMHQKKGMIKQNPDMRKKMMGNMMDMCEKDSIQCKHMAEVMSDHPQMMQMCMHKMKEKGMMGADGKMNMMNSSGEKKDTANHHIHK
jgi:hypothetical protein